MANYYDIIVRAVDNSTRTFKNVENGLKSVQARTEDVNRRLGEMTGGLTKAGAVAAAALGLAARSAITYSASINDASETTGVAVDQIVALSQALSVNGGDASKATLGIIKFNESLGDARKGAGPAASALSALGLSYAEIQVLSTSEVFARAMQGLAGITDEALRSKLAVDLLGKAGKGVNFKGIAGEMARVTPEAQKSAESIKKIGEASDKLSATWVRFQGRVAQTLGPIADAFNKLSDQQVDGLVDSIAKLAVAIVGLTAGIKAFEIIAKVIGVLSGGFLLFAKGARMAAVGVGMMAVPLASLQKTATITWSTLSKYAAPAWWAAIKRGSGLFAEMGVTFAMLGRKAGHLGTALKAIGGWSGAFAMMGKGLIRMIPFIGQVVAGIWLINDIIKLAFGVDLLDEFTTALGGIGTAIKNTFSDAFGFVKNQWSDLSDFMAKTWIGKKLGLTISKPTTSTGAVVPDTGAGGGRGGQGGATAEELKRADPVMQAAIKSWTDLGDAETAAKGKLLVLKTALMMFGTEGRTSLESLAELFAQASAEAAKLGQVLEKPTALIGREYSMAVARASEENRVFAEQLKMTRTVSQEFTNEIKKAALENQKQALFVKDLTLVYKDYENEIAATNNELAKTANRLLATDLVQQEFWNDIAKTQFELEKQSQFLGNTMLVMAQYAQEVTRATQENQRQQTILDQGVQVLRAYQAEVMGVAIANGIAAKRLTDTATVVKDLTNGLNAQEIELTKNGIALSNTGIQTQKFNIELKTLQQNNQQAAQTLAQLNAAFEAGRIPLDDYARLVGSIDSALQGPTEKFRLLTDELAKFKKETADNQSVADQVSAAFASGTINAAQYALAVSKLGEEFFGFKQLTDAYIASAVLEVAANDKKIKSIEELTQRFKSGAVSAKEYSVVASKLGVDADQVERNVNVFSKGTESMIQDIDALKLASTKAATTFSKEFTEAFVNAKNPLIAFKNFFGNVLNDIASRMTKKYLADPMADALDGMVQGLLNSNKQMVENTSGAAGGMIDIMKSAGSSIVDAMGGAADGIGGIFTNMGSGLMDSMSGVFDWIMKGIGSIGSSLGTSGGGLFDSIAGIFSGGSGGGLFDGIASIFGFAEGGRPPVGRTSLVGEQGPELFVPDSSGTIVPNDQMGQQSKNDAIVVNFNLNAIDTMTGTQFLLQNKPAIVNMIGEAYNKRGRRGPLD